MAIYFDYAATTPCDPRVIERMMDVLKVADANPSSTTHLYGEQARQVVEAARQDVAWLVGADHKEIIFTSGATESNNLAIKGLAFYLRQHSSPRKRIITLATEHHCVFDAVQAMETFGFEPYFLGVDREGRADIDELSEALSVPTALVSIGWVNNETGVIQDIESLAALSKQAGAVFHSDGAQGVGKLPITLANTKIDLLSISAHKIYGPKGIGALYVRRRPRIRMTPLLSGGGQERGLRAGTLSPFLCAGLGEACKLAQRQMGRDAEHARSMRALFLKLLRQDVPDIAVNGRAASSWPGILNLCLPAGVRGSDLIEQARGLAFSLGSACQSATLQMSHVLKAMGQSDEQARRGVRLSFGRFTTTGEVVRAANIVVQSIQTLRDV